MTLSRLYRGGRIPEQGKREIHLNGALVRNMDKLRGPIKLNSLEQTAKTHISKQKSPINQYAVFNQIKIKQTL